MFRIKKFYALNEDAISFEKLPINPKCPICGALSDRQPETADNVLCVKRENSEADDIFEPAVAHFVCRGKVSAKFNKEEINLEDDTTIKSSKNIHDFYLSYEPKIL